jgi:formate hydrogenlyase subunit 3/multisubunit Na+/H+ antiporter MnhD subunit
MAARTGEQHMGKALVVVGLIIAGVGVLVMLGVPIGRLPGDIHVKRDNFSFYFPLTTSIVLSVVLTLVMMFLRR